MNPILKSMCAISTRRSDFRISALTFCALTLLLLATSGNVVLVVGQSETAVRPVEHPEIPQAQKSRADKTSMATASPGMIRGRIVTDDGRPLTKATIVAHAITGAASSKTTRVDAEGRFVFSELPAALYIVTAVAPGFIDQSHSLGDPGQWQRHLIGAQLKITMIRGGVITGTVRNAKGDPVVGVPVTASPKKVLLMSMANLLKVAAAETDDRGIYRIYGLLPGQYTVSAGGTASGFDLDVPTYYPSNTRDSAIPVSVHNAEETTGIDIKYRGTEGHSISGIISGSVEISLPLGGISIMLSHAGTSSVVSQTMASALEPRREFSFHGIADSEYDLVAFSFPGPNDNLSIATKRVVVNGGDVAGLELSFASLASIAGTIKLDPIKPEDKCDKRGSQLLETYINLRRDDQKKAAAQLVTSLFGGRGTLNNKGEFNLRNLEAGNYRLEVKMPTDAWYVRAIDLPAAASQQRRQPAATNTNQKDAPQDLMSIKAGAKVSGVSITVAQDAAVLRGRLALAPQDMAISAGTHVHLIPAEPGLANNVLRYGETLVNSDGSFAFSNIAPGRYLILSRVESTETEPAFRRPLAWNPNARAKLRREAEAANMVVELKPCQSLFDYKLQSTADQMILRDRLQTSISGWSQAFLR